MLRSAVIGMALVVSGPAPAQEAPSLPGWMAGCWEERVGERWTEECWTAPRAGMMMGSGRSGIGETVREWEAMQIIADDPAAKGTKLAFWAASSGTAAASSPPSCGKTTALSCRAAVMAAKTAGTCSALLQVR